MNRTVHREQATPPFELFSSSVSTYSTWLDPDVPGEPAHHTYASVLWQVTEGTGWVVYEQIYTGFWTLAYLWPGISWGALVDQNYFFLPQTQMKCEVTCFTEQLRFPEELVTSDEYYPEDVDVHIRGEVTAIGPDWVDLTNRHATARIPLTPEEIESCDPLCIGTQKRILDEVDLDEFLASMREARMFDPRIIYPFRESTGNRVISDGMLDWPMDTVVCGEMAKKRLEAKAR